MRTPQTPLPNVTPRPGTPQARGVIATLCRTALDEYREAGYPFGKTMDGMLIWFEYGQKTTDN